MKRKTKVPKARSMRDKYGLSKIKKGDSEVFDLFEIGEGCDVLGYNRLKTRCSLHGKEHKKSFSVRKEGGSCFVYRVK